MIEDELWKLEIEAKAASHNFEIAKRQHHYTEERERIIKLLEDSLSDELLAGMVIALIKGETNMQTDPEKDVQ